MVVEIFLMGFSWGWDFWRIYWGGRLCNILVETPNISLGWILAIFFRGEMWAKLDFLSFLMEVCGGRASEGFYGVLGL
ncbi:hypothetical protein COU74_01345, partial [Candidatus Peregrinibacteria bacterium CG10_big_fil_rev_8_21_14_0_10_36_19]